MFAMYAFVVLWLMEIALLIFWIFNMDGFRAMSTAGALKGQGPGSIWLATLLMLGIQTFLAFVSMCIQAGSASISSSWQVAVVSLPPRSPSPPRRQCHALSYTLVPRMTFLSSSNPLFFV